MMNKSVLVLVPSPKSIGGISLYFQKLRPHLSKEIVYFIRGVRNQQSKFSKLLYPFVFIFDIFHFILLMIYKNYSLIHINTSFGKSSLLRDSVFICLAKIFKKKYIVFFRGIDFKVIKWIEEENLKYFKKTYLMAEQIWVLSEHLKSKIRDLGYKNEIILETTVADSAWLKNLNFKTSLQRFVKPQIINIIFLARLEKDKGIYEAIEAFRIINRKYSNSTLHIYGDGSEKEKILRYIKPDLNKSIFFEGFVLGESKANALSKAHIYLFPSTHGEGMPNSILESMAFGIPIITSNVGGIPDFFIQPQMGYITKDISPLHLSFLIEKLISNLEMCKEISIFNYNYAKEHFYTDVVARRIMKHYNSVLYDK